MLDWALRYIRLGSPVLPLQVRGKAADDPERAGRAPVEPPRKM